METNQMTSELKLAVFAFIFLLALMSIGCSKQELAGGCCLNESCTKSQVGRVDDVTQEFVPQYSCFTSSSGCYRCDRIGG